MLSPLNHTKTWTHYGLSVDSLWTDLNTNYENLQLNKKRLWKSS